MHFVILAEYHNGEKTVKEKYLVDAVSVTEAEAKFTGWSPDNFDDLNVQSCGMLNLDDIIKTKNEEEKYFLCRIKYPETTKKGKVIWRSFEAMSSGEDIKEGLARAEEKYCEDDAMGNQVKSIMETQIIIDDDLAFHEE